MTQNKYVRIKASQKAKSVLDGLARSEDMTRQCIASRLYEWFCKQPRMVQLALLSRCPEEILPDIIRSILQRLADPDISEAVLDDPKTAHRMALAARQAGQSENADRT